MDSRSSIIRLNRSICSCRFLARFCSLVSVGSATVRVAGSIGARAGTGTGAGAAGAATGAGAAAGAGSA